jgi:hypothetical protein
MKRLDQSEAERSQADKDFYRKADYLQRSSTLADGCAAAEYSKKALAFMVHIRPHLPYSISDDDAIQHLITLMPKTLREGGRRLKHEITLEGRQHEFMYVVNRCTALVHK